MCVCAQLCGLTLGWNPRAQRVISGEQRASSAAAPSSIVATLFLFFSSSSFFFLCFFPFFFVTFNNLQRTDRRRQSSDHQLGRSATLSSGLGCFCISANSILLQVDVAQVLFDSTNVWYPVHGESLFRLGQRGSIRANVLQFLLEPVRLDGYNGGRWDDRLIPNSLLEMCVTTSNRKDTLSNTLFFSKKKKRGTADGEGISTKAAEPEPEQGRAHG